LATFRTKTKIFDIKYFTAIIVYNKIGVYMNKRDQKIEQYIAESTKLGLDLPSELINKVTVGLGPSIHTKNSEYVSCSSSSELDTVKKSFLQKKLGLEIDESKLDSAIKKVCETMGSSNRNKYRALFYALLVVEFKKESVYE
jgi:hypothetical protein